MTTAAAEGSITTGGGGGGGRGEPPRRRLVWLIVAAITLAAGGLRLAAARDAFWIDEIASWRFARLAPSAPQIFYGLHSDNNHHLNTLALYLLGDRRDWTIYRLPPVLFGTASVWLAAVLARQWRPHRTGAPHAAREESSGDTPGGMSGAARRDGGDDAAAVIAAMLVGFSYLLVHYGSEARGYAYGFFFSLLALFALRRAIDRPSSLARLAFAGCGALALLSHLSFLYVYAGVAAWSAIQLSRDGRGRLPLRLTQLHGPFLAFFALMYAIDLSRMEVAGGPRLSLFGVLGETAAAVVGGPPLLAALVIGVTLELAIVYLARQRRAEWVLYAVACVAAPALLLLATRHPYVYPRYFALAVPYYFLLIAGAMGDLWRRGRSWQTACALLLCLFLAGSAVNHRAFFTGGRRGQYLEALRHIEASTAGRPATVGSTRDGRNQMVVEFYARHLGRPDAIAYVTKDRWTAAGATEHPEWLIADAPTPAADIPPEIASLLARYELQRTFPHSGLSGVHWHLYRRRPE